MQISAGVSLRWRPPASMSSSSTTTSNNTTSTTSNNTSYRRSHSLYCDCLARLSACFISLSWPYLLMVYIGTIFFWCLPLASIAGRLLQTSYKHLSLLWQMVVPSSHIAGTDRCGSDRSALTKTETKTGPSLTLGKRIA